MFGLFKKKRPTRKERSEKLLKKEGIKVNYNLPEIESDQETTIRTANEVAKRVSVLAAVSMVAFDTMTSEQVTDYLKKYNLWAIVTPKEKEFLENPTDEKKDQESWKCEGIWTLMWALEVVDAMGESNRLSNLNEISPDDYPIGEDKDPRDFIKTHTQTKTKSVILDMNDLYYRLNWACVNARVNGEKLDRLNSSVVYERHYALNWLINYQGAEWDDVSCDT